MTPLTCPRRHPDTRQVCGTPLADGARYGPCPPCTADIAERHRRRLHDRLGNVGAALAEGYTIDEHGDFVLPRDDEATEVIASDRAGAPARRR